MESLSAKSRAASQLRQRRHQLARQFGIPQELVGNSLVLSHRRCGKANCRCSSGPGHAQWTLSHSRAGIRQVEKVPRAWVEQLERAVLETQAFVDAIGEVMDINLKLIRLSKQELKKKGSSKKVRGAQKRSKSRSTFRSTDRSSVM
jgi:hypothetical protein